ncbi:hypothetical protein [Haladaptatus pallidirubidus]|nr:hypothetical protein [Haladaptatus pallidirubidus]
MRRTVNYSERWRTTGATIAMDFGGQTMRSSIISSSMLAHTLT